MPDNWAWCRLPEIAVSIFAGGDKPTICEKTKTNECTIPIFSNGIENNGLYGYTNKANVEIPSVTISARGTIGFTCVREEPFMPIVRLITITPNYGINLYYLKAVIDSLLVVGEGSSIPQLTVPTIKEFILPLPPENEQKNIVEAITAIFENIDSLNKEKYDLQTTIKNTKSKILDLAIHGKLVPQDPNDETAEELLKRIATSDNRPYKKIDEDETLFDIPESWSWCTLGEIYTHTTGKALKKTNNKGTLRKYITTSNLYWNSFDFSEVREMYFTDDELEKCTIKKGDLILCNGGDVGRAAIWNYDYDICYQNHVSRLRPKNKDISNSFFLYLIMIYKQQGMLNGKGVGITSLSASDLLSAVIPLPPYPEQQRIVSKIEELFSYLDKISSNLE